MPSFRQTTSRSRRIVTSSASNSTWRRMAPERGRRRRAREPGRLPPPRHHERGGAGAPRRRPGRRRSPAGGTGSGRRPASGARAVLMLAERGVIGAGFALPRDAGRRPALQRGFCWEGYALLPRFARRADQTAFQAVPALLRWEGWEFRPLCARCGSASSAQVSRSRAMPVGDRRSAVAPSARGAIRGFAPLCGAVPAGGRRS